MIKKRILYIFAVSMALVSYLPYADANESASTKSGYRNETSVGGPTSVTEQLAEDDLKTEPAVRFPEIDRLLTPWFETKKKLNDKYGLQLGVDYNLLYQHASETLEDNDDQAASGVFRVYGKWTLLGRDTKNKGSLIFKVENRHRIGADTTPAELGFDVGYNGITGMLFSDIGSFLADLNWQQLLNDGNGGMIIGRYDPNDYINVSAQTNPWTTFSNLAISLNTSIALPDFSYGIGGGHWISSGVGEWFVLGTINDANGTAENLDFFEGGSEFFAAVELGWAPERTKRYLNHLNITAWHVDERQDVGLEESQGIAIGGNWTEIEDWMIFFQAGISDGAAPLANASATVGAMKRFFRRDLLGVGVNWSDPANEDLRDQYTTELFYRFQFSENLAITPSVQWLVDPANNTDEDQIWITGLRMRLSL